MAEADLSVTKTGSPNPVNVGEPLVYTIIVRNNGPDDATSVVMEDTIPTGVCISEITIDEQFGTYCYYDGMITWNIGVLAPGETATMTVTVIPEIVGLITNVATVDSEEVDDPNQNNNTATETVTVVELDDIVDLILIKESCPAETTLGEPFSYLITVLNNSPTTANNVIVTDVLPPNVTNPIVTTSKGTSQVVGNVVTINIGSLFENERAVITITVTPTAEGSIINTAEVTSDELDATPENNTDQTTTLVQPAADVSITKTASHEEALLGETVTYHLEIINNGPSDASSVTVVDTLPENVDVVSIIPSQGACSQLGNFITCTLGTIMNGGTASIEIAIKAKDQGLICNSATVSASEFDPNDCNNMATVCAYVRRVAETDLSVTKTHCPEPITICNPVKYTITVTNNGPGVASGVVLVDQLPPSLQIISVTSNQGKCIICPDNQSCESTHYQPKSCECHDADCECCQPDCTGPSQIVCQLGSIPIEESVTVEVCVKPRMLGTITNTAIVTANEEDINPTNNQVTDSLTVLSEEEFLDYLIDEILNLVSLGLIEEQVGDLLITFLKKAKFAFSCHDFEEALAQLIKFVKKLKKLICDGVIPKEQGCALVKAVKMGLM